MKINVSIDYNYNANSAKWTGDAYVKFKDPSSKEERVTLLKQVTGNFIRNLFAIFATEDWNRHIRNSSLLMNSGFDVEFNNDVIEKIQIGNHNFTRGTMSDTELGDKIDKIAKELVRSSAEKVEEFLKDSHCIERTAKDEPIR